MALTIVGTAHLPDRRARPGTGPQFGWLGAVVLMTSPPLIRVAEDVRAPELYTLPAAVLLIAVGAWRLRTDPEASSFRMLGSGLTLALLPSLLLALDEPVSLRGALIGAAGVLVLGVGVAATARRTVRPRRRHDGRPRPPPPRAGRRRGPSLDLARAASGWPSSSSASPGRLAGATWTTPAAT